MNKSFFTVGIGASAGGQAALTEFFDQLSPDSEAAFVVVTHLMRDRRSILNHILSKHTLLPVLRVEEDMPVLPGHIYVMTENTTVEVRNGWLKVRQRDERIENMAVDIFFESLADDFGKKAVGIILSGGGSDGLRGALKINKLGGNVMVQDPHTAQVNGMPNSIIDHDHPTVIRNPSELAANVNHLCRNQKNIESQQF